MFHGCAAGYVSAAGWYAQLPCFNSSCCHPLPAESARLLGVLIRSAPKLVLPYTAPVLRALVGKLRAAGSSAAATNTSAAQPNIKPPSQGAFLWALRLLAGI